MAKPIPAPDPLTLLPPLLAFLPTSFASVKPPPALLPLLSPILRQRLQIHTSTPSSNHDSWLRLLCWDSAKAERIKETVENGNFEPHPASGEIEVGDVDTIKYKRLDTETLRAQVPLPDWELTAAYVWCFGSDEEDSWKLAELLPFDSELSRDLSWSNSVNEAEEEVAKRTAAKSAPLTGFERKKSIQEDDYWEMYDHTPGRTPARQGSINPTTGEASEDDYYARYGDVQPALDGHDPDEASADVGESSLNGNALNEMLSRDRLRQHMKSSNIQVDSKRLTPPAEDVVHPAPSSPSSRAGSDTVAKLERTVEQYAASEIAIRQHVSSSIKSMYRLAKAAGMARDDFEDMVQRELESLSIFDRDD